MSIYSICQTNGIKINDRRRVSMGGGTKRNRNQIKYIVRHHSGVNVDQTMAILEGYWKNDHGWNTGGYHVVIHMDGSVDWNYDYETVSNGVGNYNTPTFHISVLGNGKFTDAQERSFKLICKEVQRELGIPTKNVWGHNEFPGHQTNSCPGINMNYVRKSLDANAVIPGGNVIPNGNVKPTYKTIKVGKQATHWETGSEIPKFVIGGVYDVLEEQKVNKSNSTKKLLIGKGKVPTGWLLEQDVDGFVKPATNKPSITPQSNGDIIIKSIQANVGEKQDGFDGPKTRRNVVQLLQRFVGSDQDGIIGNDTVSKTGTIKSGNVGWHVYALQSMLYLKGYKNVGNPDKIFGNGTLSAVKDFQRNNGLSVDGMAGRETLLKLFK